MSATTRLAYLAALLPLGFSATTRADFALKDGDIVAFLGDSITAARTYGKIVENYTLLRFPGRKVRFLNAGWGGDTAAGGLKRLERDIFDRGATVLTVAYGINDIGWGTKADDEHKKIYLDAIRGIVEACKGRGVRVFICSAAVTAEDPETSEGGFLQRMGDEGMALSRSLGEGAIDVQRTMRAIQRRVKEANAHAKGEKSRETLHADDGIHLNDLGQKAMALAILKGLGAPAEVSSATLDADGARLIEASGCRISDLSGDRERLEFTRLDEGLPLNLGVFGALSYRFIPFPDELNRYMVTIKNLREGRYEVVVDGRSLGAFGSAQLASGVNICSATADGWEPGGPWDAQAALLNRLTDARDELAVSRRLAGHYLPGRSDVASWDEQADAINSRVERLQRAVVSPSPYRFVIRPAPEAGQKP